ncbi:MAG TPA: hypothetical protein DCM87_00870 [Planctomycetes bacterium]|nr:hypothetical protein [Planctomycetota bacterium]
MTTQVFTAPEAEAQLAAALSWWRTANPAAPSLLLDEFQEAVQLISETPEVGPAFTRTTIPGVRRLLLRRVKHWVYYMYDARHAVAYVLAVWSARRGTPPPGVSPRP